MPPKPPKKSRAEHMRLLREKLRADPAAHEEYKATERARYQKRKKEGKVKTIYSLNDRGKRAQRRKWKLEKRKQRLQKKDDDQEPGTSKAPQNESSHQRRRGRQQIKTANRQAYRTIDKQKKTIEELQSEIRSLKRRMRNQKTSPSEDNEATTLPAIVCRPTIYSIQSCFSFSSSESEYWRSSSD